MALLDAIHSRYLPNKVVAGFDPAAPGAGQDLPLLEDKVMQDGLPTAYVCQNYACQQPVTAPSALAEQLAPSADTGMGPLTILS